MIIETLHDIGDHVTTSHRNRYGQHTMDLHGTVKAIEIYVNSEEAATNVYVIQITGSRGRPYIIRRLAEHLTYSTKAKI